MNEKGYIGMNGMRYMTKTTIRVDTETRKRVRILAAQLDITMEEAINMAADCLEKYLRQERR